MGPSLRNRYRVDNVPAVLRPLFYAYGFGLGALLFVFQLLLGKTIPLTFKGREHLARHPNHIFCLWHDAVPLIALCARPKLAPALDGSPQVWLQHPSWYMKPIHFMLRLAGVKELILGSTGHFGRQAADRLVQRLRWGCSTVINPDGPYGPPHVLKKGILHVALQSGVPVVVLRFHLSRHYTLNSWDRKKLACPFSRLEIRIGEPIYVTQENFERAGELIQSALG